MKMLSGAYRRYKQRGSVITETAVALPVLLLIVFGAIDYGYATFAKNVLLQAANAGARHASLADSTNETIALAVQAELEKANLDRPCVVDDDEDTTCLEIVCASGSIDVTITYLPTNYSILPDNFLGLSMPTLSAGSSEPKSACE